MTDPTAVRSREELRALRVAAVMDEFTHGSFRPECDLHQLVPEDVEAQLAEIQPELLFIESAWRGHHDLWGNKVARRDEALVRAVDWCRARGVPTVFWNKEDPVHFGTFLRTASLFDHVFTTDIDVIDRYRSVLGHDRVHLLPFASQPAMFNPVGGEDRIDAFCFAGAYYARYPDRARDFEGFVDQLTTLHPFLIYDRNHGGDDPNYAFPERYRPFILGRLPYERIQRAYKGYTYTINMNSVTQSQSMCARRVFELLASNAVVVSNYARAVRTLLGDLVVTTSNGVEAARRIGDLDDPVTLRKLKLAGLRKVMSEYTYGERFAFVASQALDTVFAPATPPVEVIAHVPTTDDAHRIADAVHRQSHPADTVTFVVPRSVRSDVSSAVGRLGATTRLVTTDDTEPVREGHHVAVLHPEDHYGDNYLLDLVLATTYADAAVITKAPRYRNADGSVAVTLEERRYVVDHGGAPLRRSLVDAGALPTRSVAELAADPTRSTRDGVRCLTVDEFNYCEGGAELPAVELEPTADLPDLDTGTPLHELRAMTRTSGPTAAPGAGPRTVDLDRVRGLLSAVPSDRAELRVDAVGLHVTADVDDADFRYVWGDEPVELRELDLDQDTDLHVEKTGDLEVKFSLRFVDEAGDRTGGTVVTSNENITVRPPADARRVIPGLRLAGAGTACIRRIVVGGIDLSPKQLALRAPHVLVTNIYPDYDDLYRNAFVHKRVDAYRDAGLRTDVVAYRDGASTSFREYRDTDVIEGGERTLDVALASTPARTATIHFLLPPMWPTVRRFLEERDGRVQVWMHGYEVQAWHRRSFNYATQAQADEAKREIDLRLEMWREVFAYDHPDLHFVFVSQYLADVAQEDVGVTLDPERYSIIPNPIDTDLFAYLPKPADQRFNVLSIRPYASRVYANDVSVAAILALRDEPWFGQAQFRIIGDGPLFEETVAPLRDLDNVRIERGFVTQERIAELHREHGVFLCPSRMDTHGVSRDEAMASGLVPVASRAGAVPEFVDAECGMLTNVDDVDGVADALRRVITSPELFTRLSAAAAARVRGQAGHENVIPDELAVIGHGPEDTTATGRHTEAASRAG